MRTAGIGRIRDVFREEQGTDTKMVLDDLVYEPEQKGDIIRVVGKTHWSESTYSMADASQVEESDGERK